MRKRKTLLTITTSVLAFFLSIVGCGKADSTFRKAPLRTEDPISIPYALDGTATGGSSAYASASDITQNGISWKVTGNTTQNPWRIGGNTLSGVDRPIYSVTPLPYDVAKIEISFGAASSITVNSLTVGVYSTAEGAAAGGAGGRIASFTPSFVASKIVTVQKQDSTSWNNCYYNITLNVTVSDNTNRFVQFNSATFVPVATGVSLDRDELTLVVGGESTLTATLSPTGAVGSVTWSSSDGDVASVNQSGKVHGNATGSATITARISETISATCSVTVSTAAIHATSIALDEDSKTLIPGQSFTLSATVEPNDSTDTVIWSTSDDSVATVEDGVVTAVSVGSAIITAPAGEQTDTCAITVEPEHGTILLDPLTVTEAATIGSELEHNNETTKEYYVNGIVSQIVSAFSGSPAKATFWLATNETTVKGFECYLVTLADGLNATDLKVGSEATIHCTIKRYNTTIENGTVGEVVSLEYASRPATSVSLNNESVNLEKAGQITLKASVLPVYATETVVWSSSNENVATVNQTGRVIAVDYGSASITATAGSFSASCTVYVCNKVIDFTDKSYAVTKPESAQADLSTVEVSDYNLNILNCHNNNGGYDYMMLATSQLKTSNSLISNKTPVSGAISKIVFKIRAGSAANAVYNATISNAEVTGKVTSDTYSRTGGGDIVITPNVNDNLRYFAISCSTQGSNGQIDSIGIFYETTKETISEIDTLSSLSYSDYTKVSEDNYTFTDLLIRYGGFISQDLWERLDDELDIQGYGVILSTGNEEIEDLYAAAKDEGDTVIEALAEFVDGTNIKRFHSALTQSKTHPAEATTEQKTYMGVDTAETYYIWTLGKGISSEHMTTVYNVVAYIIVDGDIVFLNAAKESVKTLAADLIDNDVYEESDFGGSLKYLADLPVLP